MIVESRQSSSLLRHQSAGLVALFLLGSLMAAPAFGVTLTFREGLNGYTGTQDTYIQQDPANQGTNNGAALDFGWDGDDPASTGFDVDGLIRFDNIFGAGGSQIPLGAEITEATLFLTVFNTGDPGSVRRVLTNWTEASTYSSFCGGGCVEGVAYTPEVGTLTAGTATEISVNVTSSVQAWSDGATNFGWIIRPSTGTDGVDVRSSEYATTVTQRPRLEVRFNEGQPPVGNLVREPYLQRLSSSSVTICWRSDVPSDSRVRYGTTQGVLNLSATSATNTVDHIVTINSLTPATRYYYDVGSTTAVQGGGTAAYYFETAPVTGSATPFRFWAVGDGGNGTATQVNVMNAMLTVAGGNPPDFAVQLGDIAYNSGTDSEFTTNHFAPYAPVLRNTTMWPTLGNHEGASTSSGSPGASTGPYYDSFVLPTAGEAGGMSSGTEAYYSFDYGNAHFVSLNSEQVSRSAVGPMANWLAADLAATTQEWLIVFFHHPPYSRGTHNSDSFSDSGGRMVEMRENILPILEAGGVDLVLAGHSHSYERSYLVDGAQGYGNAPNFPTPNFATLEANGNIIDDGDGRPAGDGAYLKSAGISANEGAVYVVAGHGGQGTGGSINHPVMFYSETVNGSCLVDISGNTLTLQNIRASGVVSDTFTIQKGALPPRVKSTMPPKFAVISSLTAIEVIFTTDVTGVDAADLTVNGTPADSVFQNAGDTYTFMIPSMPGDGNRSIVLAPGGIADAVMPALLFEGDSWSYTINTQPPVVASVSPPPDTNHVVLPNISVMFDKPVVGVTAANLTVNGSPATVLSGVSGTSGPYVFEGYAAPELGPASVILAAGVIQDTEGRPFAGSSWSYTLQGGLVINEFLASNNTTNADEFGGFDDWVEIYNPTNAMIDMSGMYLTDNLGFPTQYEIPSGVTIGPGSYLIFWCDSTPAQGPLHTNFNILRTGEDIGLFDTAANGFAMIDGFSFTTQTTDVTSGRFPNGTGPITVLASPSPGASNGGEPPVIDPLPIVEGDTWKYFKGTAEPSTPVASLLWTQVGFDDSTWLEGPSGFGFGDNDDNTTLTDMQNNYASVYTRRLFNIPNAAAVTSLTLTVDYDDAFVCYINGAQVARSANITGTPPLFNTLASSGHEASGGDSSPQPPAVFNLSPGILNSGTNVIAVQGHNQTLASSDFSLITVLEAEISQCQNNGDCNDSNPCTTDICNMGNCENTNNSSPCDDLNACTTGDTCSGGTCAGTPVTCPMGQVCNNLNGQCESQPVMLMFQDGVSGYDATVDTFIHAGSATANNSTATVLVCDGSPPAADERQVLLRFDNIFGNNIDQIPLGSTIQSASITVMVTNASLTGASLHRMTQAWLDTNNWNTFSVNGNGIQAGTECEAAADVSSFLNSLGSHTIDVTASLVAWSAGQANNGWVWINNGDDSWQFNSNELATVGSRPKLTVTFLPPTGCMNAGDCDDGNPCTDDICNMGTCENPNNMAACNDGDLCTTGDICGGGSCAGTPVNCPMGQTCNPTNGMCESVPTMLTFRNGLNGYSATADAFIRQQNVNQNNGATEDLRWDTEENGANTPQYTLLRFDDIFGAGPNQIPLGSTINAATLTYTVGGDANAIGDNGLLHESLVVWDESTVTYANFGGDSGVQTDEYAAASIATLTAATATSFAVDVTASVSAWSASPATNLGWVVIPTNTNGVQVRSSEFVATPTERPTLTVTFTAPTGCLNAGDCDDGNPCTDDVCNMGMCEYTNNTDACDDGDLCTTGDICGGGSCAGTPVNCPKGQICNPSNGMCEEVFAPAAGDVIIAGFQATNNPTGQDPGEFIELFNTTNQTIALDTMEIETRIGTGPIEWSLVADLTGKTIAPHSFFLIAETAVIAEGGVHDVETALDLATGEGGPGEQAISIALRIDSVHMDYVVYGNHLAPTPAGDAPGDISFAGYPRAEVIRALSGTSFVEGMTRRVSAEDLYAGHAVEGYYADENSLPDSFPVGVWTSVHSNTNGSYVARSSASAGVDPVGCMNDGDCDDGLFCNGVETCNTGTGECQPGAGDPCMPMEFCNETTDTCDECVVDGDCDDGNACNGAETCVAGTCQPGTPLVCDDGDFCNGVETCDSMLGCQAGVDPCLPNEFCNESTDTCDECGVDGDCDDGNACNGMETCVAGVCQPGTPPVCDDGLFCNGLETCDPELGCVAGQPCQPGEQCDEAADLCRQPLMSCLIANPMPVAGGSTNLEIFLSDVLNVRGYETEISIVRTSGTGTVSVNCPGGVVVDDNRPDFLFFGVSNVFPVVYCAAKQAAAARLSGGSNVTGAPAYLSEYVLSVSPDAAPGSTFEISILPSPGSDLTNTSVQPIPFQVSPPCVLTVGGGCPTPACLTVQITIPGLIAGPVDRDVEVTLTRCGFPPVTITETVSFTPDISSGVGELSLTNVDPLTTWVSVREGHTLSRLTAVDFSGDNEDAVSVTLVSGDLQTAVILQDDIVDILDFAILSARFNTMVTDCVSGDPEDCSLGADVTGDGIQNTADFTAIQINFFQISDAQDACPAFAPSGKPGRGPLAQGDVKSTSDKAPAFTKPRGLSRIGVNRLRAMDSTLGSADINGDGTVDARDIREFSRQHGLPILPAFELKLRSMEAAENSLQYESR